MSQTHCKFCHHTHADCVCRGRPKVPAPTPTRAAYLEAAWLTGEAIASFGAALEMLARGNWRGMRIDLEMADVQAGTAVALLERTAR